MKTEDYRNLSSELRKAADSIDRIVDNKEDEIIDSKTKQEKEDKLLAEFLVHVLKIQVFSNKGFQEVFV